MNIIEKIDEIAKTTYNSSLEEAKVAGNKIVGYFCSYIPVEVIHAAGCVPYRMRAVESPGTDRGDAYYSPLNCSFVRHCFDKALKGDFAFLDGVIFMNGCDHTRRMYDNWRYSETKPDFLHMHFVPHVVGSNAPEEYRANILNLKETLEKTFKISITDEKLGESIRLYNTMRRLLMSIEEKRKGKQIPITGSEMLSLVMAVSAIPVENAIGLLTELLKFIEGREAAKADNVRVFILAGCMEEPEQLKLYEKAGGTIVADGFCFGARFYNKQIDESKNPIDALGEGYLNSKLSCPRMMDDYPRRLDNIKSIVREYAVDALVVEKLKFCDMWGWEIERLRRESKEHLLPPILAIEREYLGGATGQIKTRIQAFFEQMGKKNSFQELRAIAKQK